MLRDLFLFVTGLITFGLCSFVVGKVLFEQLQVSMWTPVIGQVLESKLARKTFKSQTLYYLQVSYSFSSREAGIAKTQTGYDTTESLARPDLAEVQRALKRLAMAAPIVLRYNPKNSAQSCHRCTLKPSEFQNLLNVAVIGLIGFGLMFPFILRMRQSRRHL